MQVKLEYALTTVERNELKFEYKSYNYIGSPERGEIQYTTRFDYFTVQNPNQFPKDILGVLTNFFW